MELNREASEPCLKCGWSDAYSGNAQVCGWFLQGGETVYIKDGKPSEPCVLPREYAKLAAGQGGERGGGEVSREVEFDPEAVCDVCGKPGAFDFYGDFACVECASPPPKVSRPIKPTPTLRGKHAREFERKIAEGLKHPVGPVPTPKLKEAYEMVLKTVKAQAEEEK